MPCRKTVARLAGLLTIVLFLLAFGFSAHGEIEENGKPGVSNPPTPYEDIRNLIEASLTTESDDIKDLKTKLVALDQYEEVMNATLSAISLQQTAHANLLLMPESDVQKIIQAKTDNESAIANLSDMMKKAQDELASANGRLAQVEEQLLLNQKTTFIGSGRNAPQSPHRETDPPDQNFG